MKRVSIKYLLILLPLILASCTASDQNPQGSLALSIKERAALSDKAANHQLSGKLYGMLIKLEPDNVDNHILHMRSLRLGQNRAGLEAYLSEHDVLMTSTLNSSQIIEILFTLISFDFLSEANNFLVKQEENIESESTLIWLRGAITERNGRTEQALMFYKICLELDPSNKPCQIDYDRLQRK
jgi:tetratricopeptide (TPR) repeat protein